jgi:predicted ATPase
VLQNLTENDTSQLMAQALKLKTVPDEVSREIYKRSQGNPFLTEEIIYALRDSGKIQIFKNGTMSIAPDFQSTG